MRDLILLPEILPSVAVGDNTRMCLTSLILFVAAQKIIERILTCETKEADTLSMITAGVIP